MSKKGGNYINTLEKLYIYSIAKLGTQMDETSIDKGGLP
jgi:hypothetical protein